MSCDANWPSWIRPQSNNVMAELVGASARQTAEWPTGSTQKVCGSRRSPPRRTGQGRGALQIQDRQLPSVCRSTSFPSPPADR